MSGGKIKIVVEFGYYLGLSNAEKRKVIAKVNSMIGDEFRVVKLFPWARGYRLYISLLSCGSRVFVMGEGHESLDYSIDDMSLSEMLVSYITSCFASGNAMPEMSRFGLRL